MCSCMCVYGCVLMAIEYMVPLYSYLDAGYLYGQHGSLLAARHLASCTAAWPELMNQCRVPKSTCAARRQLIAFYMAKRCW